MRIEKGQKGNDSDDLDDELQQCPTTTTKTIIVGTLVRLDTGGEPKKKTKKSTTFQMLPMMTVFKP